MAIQGFDVEFTKDGALYDLSQANSLIQALPQYSDLLVLSHGWNNDMNEARELYDELLSNMTTLLEDDAVKGLHGRSFAALRIFWPSKKFTDEELIPGGGAASAFSENHQALIIQLERLKTDPVRLGGAETTPERDKAVDKALALIAELESSVDARREYVTQLRLIMNRDDAHPEDSSADFFTRDPEEIFDALSHPVNMPFDDRAGGAASLSGAAGIDAGDLMEGIGAAARRIANYVTYYVMKSRAGLVGRTGVAALLSRIRSARPDVRLHLVGHSFGGRLVTSAANSLARDTPAVTLSLLQAAFSHNGLAKNFDEEGHDGAFRNVLADRRVSGPIIITNTKNDKAVGIAYPLASAIARDAAAAIGDANDPYGGMGRNGAQHTPEVSQLSDTLLAVGMGYRFAQGKVFNLRADEFISSHGDVRGRQVAYAILSAAVAV